MEAKQSASTLGQKWPQLLWLVRHGQSAGNVARDEAELNRHLVIDLKTRDVDTPLSALGEEQATALGKWFGLLAEEARPDVILASPYVRAKTTAQRIASAMSADAIDVCVDERLREKEFGILDGLTTFGIERRYPDLFQQRRHVGKFYFRPPGGESWCDVVLRLRSIIDTITREHRGARLLIVTHQVVVNCFRYLLERLDEAEILDIDRKLDVPNCSITSYRFDATAGDQGKLLPELVNFVAPLEQEGTPVTVAKDMPAAAKP